MSVEAIVSVLWVSACYAVASVLRIELSNGRRVSGVAAFGPAVVALGPHGYDVAPYWFLLCTALVGQAVGMGFRRSGWGEFVITSGLLGGAAGVFVGVAKLFADGPFAGLMEGSVLTATAMSVVPYAVADLLILGRGRGGSYSWGALHVELRWELPLYVALGSTAGLVILAFGSLGWVAFPLLMSAFLVTWYEFRRFAEARQTYAQTVRAMGRLTEHAGYAPLGYHERVSSIAGQVGRNLGLSWDSIYGLELVGQVRRVGAVSLADPTEIGRVDPSVVEENGGRILEETGHLAPYAHFLLPGEASREGEVLRVVDRFVELEASGCRDPVGVLREGEEHFSEEVLEALGSAVHA